ncbi:Rieske 2Fe-2S domain-containing protein [Pseudorhodoplanes sp.]|uniref:Rieske 2Fe-2S domain-containing protein n=1 Tax=Pseudorhodoplanes sp. TaxID=1934341 RepID=UPI002CF09C29|nr:Rieske 2Fe-2S domain-containing protein [Pseudorhodoplanes sp.]HWV55496.1 Rieske 2Fe-2S domain-containing protein [Pseudorhodoplanes sp.]
MQLEDLGLRFGRQEAKRPTLTPQELAACIDFRPDGVTRIDRRIYLDPAIFELEMELIWERVWIFVAHESQLQRPGDYVTASIGRQPVFAMRSKAGDLGVFLNACPHRGAMVCRLSRGNARIIACPYHGWTFNSDGSLIAPKEEAVGAYPAAFDKKELGLKRVPRVENYRGFIFACLDSDIAPLADYLGDAKVFIDMLVDQGDAVELIKGVCSYTYDGNWKLQAENGVDGYHPSTVHWNFIATQQHRAKMDTQGDKTRGMNPVTDPSKVKGGYFDFGRGHTMIWGDWTNPQDRFNYNRREEFARRMGALRADWVIGRLRNLLLYPSVFLMDQQSSQIRVIQPISVNKTKVTVYGLAPVGETPEERRKRIRYYEDFFNASGMATPDDLSEFDASQIGFSARAVPRSDFSRGAGHQISGPNDEANKLGINPLSSGSWIGDEGIYLGQYAYWRELMVRGMERKSE